tara:strand:+ start:1856 stop:3049 length:1194 start_codon:yes stop_codon:yes gene_type:complete
MINDRKFEDIKLEDRKFEDIKINIKSENSWAKSAEETRKKEFAMDGTSLKITKNISKMKIVRIKDCISLDTWMEDNYVDSALVFDSLNVIPTTHNSGAVFPQKIECCIPWLWAKCQGYTIRDQLMMGIRCLDLRLKLVRIGKDGSEQDNRYQIVHFFDSTYTFMDIMKDVNEFLETNNGETVFLMIKPEWNTRDKWNFSDLEDLWGKIKGFDRVLKTRDEHVSMSQLRFNQVRGKIVIMPDGHIYNTYNNNVDVLANVKVNQGRDIDVIHGVNVLYPNFLNRCENWNSQGVRHAKQRIEDFLMLEKHRTSSVERRMNGDESKLFPLVETNVVLFKGSIPPYVVAKCMHPYLKKECIQKECFTDEGMCYVKRLGFVMLDFANEGVVRNLLTNNLCKYY